MGGGWKTRACWSGGMTAYSGRMKALSGTGAVGSKGSTGLLLVRVLTAAVELL